VKADASVGAGRAYYNEIEPHAVEWLRRLILIGELPDGDVDDRSIVDVHPDDLKGYVQCHFFAGIGGWPLAARWAGWSDDRPLWTGSCPCQPLSSAGLQRGHADERHLWPAFYRLIAKCRPPVLFGEQVASKTGREWLSGVRADLEASGYACGTAIIPACGVGAPHRRDRQWFVADAKWNQQPRQEPRRGSDRRVGREQQLPSWDGGWRAALAGLRTVDDGISRCVEGTDAARNAIVPQVAAEFIGAYLDTERLAA
jgi:DNA (cytosine-5)-methyltransferase 1